MKIRNGFVSNSSSSSFVIVSKNGKLTKEKIMKALDVSEKSPLYSIAEDITKTILYAEKQSPEEYKDMWVWSDDEDSNEKFKKEYPKQYEIYENAKNNNWQIYEGSADSVDDAPFCDMELEYEDDDLIINKEGGY